MDKKDIIVVGASAGGFDAIKKLISSLPTDFSGSIFIVWHMSPDVHGILPSVINRLKTLPASHAVDMEPIIAGRVYVAPTDHHLLLEKNRVRITRGPKENRFRPAVDPLFRSAAHVYRKRVIGIVLSGALDDGTAGLWIIKEYGGTAIVQDPDDAEVPSMPENAMRAVKIDHSLPVAEIGALLTCLVNEPVGASNGSERPVDKRTQLEISIAMEDNVFSNNVLDLGELTPYTCPECHGVLTSLTEGGRIRFRCHTGHAFSADSLLSSLTENIEESFWTAIRSVQESIMLLNHMGDHFAEINQSKLAAMYFKKAKEADMRANLVRRAVLHHEQLNADSIKRETEEPLL